MNDPVKPTDLERLIGSGSVSSTVLETGGLVPDVGLVLVFWTLEPVGAKCWPLGLVLKVHFRTWDLNTIEEEEQRNHVHL